ADLEAAHDQRMFDLKVKSDKEAVVLQEQITTLESQRTATEKQLDAVRGKWQDDLRSKERALKEVQATVSPQEAELRKRFAAEEEMILGQVAALKARQRTLERDFAMAKGNIEKTQKDQADVRVALESDHRAKEEALRQRSEE